MVTAQEHLEVLDKFKKYGRRATAGFVLLLAGVIIAIHNGDVANRHAAKSELEARAAKGAVIRVVLCEQLTEDDLNLYKFVKQHPPSNGGFGGLITPQLQKESLETNAKKRAKLGYAPAPGKACNPNITPNPYTAKS